MKLLVKYLSLLIFSGLIIPFYYITATRIGFKPAQQTIKAAVVSVKAANEGFSFYQSIVKNIFPVLKNLN